VFVHGGRGGGAAKANSGSAQSPQSFGDGVGGQQQQQQQQSRIGSVLGNLTLDPKPLNVASSMVRPFSYGSVWEMHVMKEYTQLFL